MKPIHLLICLSLFVFATCLNSSVMANDRFEPSYNEMLKEHVRPQKAINGIVYNGVDYRAWKQDPRYPQVMKRLSDFNPSLLKTESEKLAFWINAYNLLTIDLIIKNGEKESIKNLGSLFKNPWKKYKWDIGGKVYTLDEIEHKILRPMGEPRIHFAINCAAISCPDLRAEAYDPLILERQLDNQVYVTLRNDTKGMQKVRNRNMIYLTRVMQWFDEDFNNGDLISWLETYRPELINRDIIIRFFPYDWSLNKTLETTANKRPAEVLIPKDKYN